MKALFAECRAETLGGELEIRYGVVVSGSACGGGVATSEIYRRIG